MFCQRVSLPPPGDGRLRLSRAGGGDQAVLVAEADAGYSQGGRGLSRFTDPADGASYVMALCYPDCGPELFCCSDQPDLTATVRFAVRVPGGWECVANGRLARREGDVRVFTPVSGMRPYDLTICIVRGQDRLIADTAHNRSICVREPCPRAANRPVSPA